MRRILTLIAVPALLLSACGSEEPNAAAGGGGDGGSAAAPATVEVSDTDLGRVLVDADGMTLYMFVPDQKKNGTPTCYDECAQAWPPLEATGELAAGDGLDDSLLGTAKRKDGAKQVTYNDLPLYLFSGDEAAGDTAGQGLNGVWWVVSPAGQPVQKEAASGTKGGSGGY